MTNITLDTNIIFDYLLQKRIHHPDAVKVIQNDKLNLFITQTVIKEIKIPEQLKQIEELIVQNKLLVLDEPRMGTPIPTPVPADLSHISPIRDAYIESYLKKHPGKQKYKVLRDFLIAEAHKISNNDYLLTTNIKDFYGNLDIEVINYDDLFVLLGNLFN